MAETNQAVMGVVDVTTRPAPGSEVMKVSHELVLLTWATFLIAAFLLHKLAWKPLLRALEHREKGIRDALDGAAAARQETARVREEGRKAVAEAAEKARLLAEEARRAAARTAAAIEQEARDQARRLLEEADREIAAARQRAAEDVRRESARLAVDMAGRLLRDEVTPEQMTAYTRRVARTLEP